MVLGLEGGALVADLPSEGGLRIRTKVMINIDDKDKIKDTYDKDIIPGSPTWFLSELLGHPELMAFGTESFCWCSYFHFQ